MSLVYKFDAEWVSAWRQAGHKTQNTHVTELQEWTDYLELWIPDACVINVTTAYILQQIHFPFPHEN
jgi:hypothetical protein